MRIFTLIVFITIFSGFAGCKKKDAVNAAPITQTGRLYKQTAVTYNYGTHVLVVDALTAYVVESTSINLDSFVDDSVTVTMKDMKYRTDNGPELYNVTTITPL